MDVLASSRLVVDVRTSPFLNVVNHELVELQSESLRYESITKKNGA